MKPSNSENNQLGEKFDSGKVRPNLIFGSMARALLAIAEVGTYGANKYSDDGWLHVDNGISRYTNARDRHQLLESIEKNDEESGLAHAAHAAWNAIARLDLMIRAEALSNCAPAVSVTDSDGWIEWNGGECPIDAGVFIDYKMRGGECWKDNSEDLRWEHGDFEYDIIAYKIHKEAN